MTATTKRHPRSTGKEGRKAYWLEQYLAMGPNRSLRSLAAMSTRLDSATSRYGSVGEYTLMRYSREDGWDAKAQEYDRQIAEQERERAIAARLKAAEETVEIRLETARAFRGLLGSAFSIDITEPVTDEHGAQLYDKQTKQPLRRVIGQRLVGFYELTPDQIRAMLAIHRTAEMTERLDYGQVTDRREITGGGLSPAVQVNVNVDDARDAIRKIDDLFGFFADAEAKQSMLGYQQAPADVDGENPDVTDAEYTITPQ